VFSLAKILQCLVFLCVCDLCRETGVILQRKAALCAKFPTAL
jgi:hypothetical protein